MQIRKSRNCYVFLLGSSWKRLFNVMFFSRSKSAINWSLSAGSTASPCGEAGHALVESLLRIEPLKQTLLTIPLINLQLDPEQNVKTSETSLLMFLDIVKIKILLRERFTPDALKALAQIPLNHQITPQMLKIRHAVWIDWAIEHS